jgi:ATP-dependent helicase/DNAse subunit B
VDPLIQELLDRNYGEEACIGITAIEDYLGCPYRFFLKYLLKVAPRTEVSFLPEALDLGILYHQIFAKFGTIYREQALIREKLPEYRDCLKILSAETFTAWQETVANDLIRVMLSTETAEIERTIERWLLAEIAWSELTNFRFHPYIMEFAFGTTGGAEGQPQSQACFEINEDNAKIRLAGRIDRIDRDRDGHFIIYDYKLGRGPTTSDLKNIKKIQIPAYLLTVEALLLGRGKAIGAAYLGLRDPSRSRGGIWCKARLNIDWRSKGELETAEWEEWLAQVRQKLVDAVKNIRAGSFRLTEEDCLTYCEYSNCCRRQEREVEMIGTYSE